MDEDEDDAQYEVKLKVGRDKINADEGNDFDVMRGGDTGDRETHTCLLRHYAASKRKRTLYPPSK